jgi:vacuolar-type H+-ATPase subunit B/Vma2
VAEREYMNVAGITGPLIIVDGVKGVGYGELVEIRTPAGEIRIGQTLRLMKTGLWCRSLKEQQGFHRKICALYSLGKPWRSRFTGHAWQNFRRARAPDR